MTSAKFRIIMQAYGKKRDEPGCFMSQHKWESLVLQPSTAGKFKKQAVTTLYN